MLLRKCIYLLAFHNLIPTLHHITQSWSSNPAQLNNYITSNNRNSFSATLKLTLDIQEQLCNSYCCWNKVAEPLLQDFTDRESRCSRDAGETRWPPRTTERSYAGAGNL
jgi:hypothetical protein